MLAMATLLLPAMGRADMEKRHVQLVTPAPFDWAEYGPTNPLRTDGSDYPCKIPHGDDFTINGTATEIAIGEEQTVSFSGWSVHGGGSCQFALTEGHAPTPDSAWKVIQSIEGGCPKANVSGNLEPGQNPDTYTFTIPDDFAPGDYTWAWTWVNKIAAAPEFYMNCAPISVTAAAAGSTKRVRRGEKQQHSSPRAATIYPDLFLANIGSASNGCTTSEAVKQQIAIAFPYPGGSVSYPNGQQNLFQQPCDGNPRNNGASASGGGGGGGGSQPAASTGYPLPTGGGGGGTMSILPVATNSLGSIAPSSSTPATSSADEAVSSGEAASSLSSVLATATPLFSTTLNTITTSTISATASAASSSGTSTTLDSPCTDGHLLCVGGTQFSTCTGGIWTTPQDLAAHTTCKEGEGVGLTIANDY
ncbi:hypothetical protein N0V82_009195 [Gnomoniopsis sp. IMI 355080]|nr:hypothetical protein N0V82_009195 [Gnomoniopsis sp. IMI 355080]